MRKDYYLGIDLGTTTVAASLIEAGSSVPLFSASSLNLQYPYFGIDSIKRIQNGLDGPSVKRLQEKAVSTFNLLTEEIEKVAGIKCSEIKSLAVAGNTVMEMALCGYPLKSLSKPPYRPLSEVFFPSITDFLPGLCPQGRELFIFPVLDGFAGGDAVSSIYYLDMQKKERVIFFADFGTNVEIAVGNREKVYITSAPAGPAFEGGNISSGMTALPGAITGVKLKEGKFEFEVIGGESPAGLCGSGIMALVYSLLKEKVIDATGRILPPEKVASESYSIVHKGEDANEIILDFEKGKPLKFLQKDLRQFQLAKSAVKSASEILMEKYKISAESDFDVFISGSFGTHIDPSVIDLLDIFPFKEKKINFIEGSVLSGCLKYLSSEKKERSDEIKKIITLSKNFPLSGSSLFEKRFIANIDFLHASALP